MEKKSIIIGADVGNFDSKSSLTSTPSGFINQINEPYGVEEYLKLDGRYYIPDQSRFKYIENKTLDDKCFVLTLFCIAKQLLDIGRNNLHIPEDEMQDFISSIDTIHLGAGLPPAHMPLYKDALKSYYKNHFGWDGIKFTYNGFEFDIKLGFCEVFPQDYAAIRAYEKNTDKPLFNGIQDYYAIDIGGYTVELMFVENGKAQGNKCVSFELGILKMYDNIVADLRRSFGKTYDHKILETFLSGKPTMLPDEVKERINELCFEWSNEIINKCRQSGALFDAYPVVMLGGGSLLLQRFIDRSPVISMKQYIEDPCANAAGYEYLLSIIMKSMGEDVCEQWAS